MKNNRWLVLIGAVIAQLCIGTIYSWSLFNYPLMAKFGFEESEVVLTFSIATFIFAFSTIISGRLYDRLGPRIVATIGGILYGGGLILSSTASSLIELYLYYGIISGAGVGFVYVCPIATLGKWFPQKKGLITGIAVGAFGLGSFIFKFIIESLLHHKDVMETFLIIGIIYTLLILIGSQLLKLPNDNDASGNDELGELNLLTRDMVKTKSFPFLFLVYFIGCVSGLLVIGVAKDIGVQFASLPEQTAANAVALIALFNASGRLFWGSMTDRMSKLKVVMAMFVITTICMGVLSLVHLNLYSFFITLAGIAFCFGGFLAVFPIITGELYGHRYLGSNYGIMYQAYGVAALTGPLIGLFLGDLKLTFMIASVITIIGLIMTFILHQKRIIYHE